MFGGRFKPSPSMVIACAALLVALGGTSVAAITLPRASVGTAQLKANAVNSAKVANGSLLRADFRSGQIPAGPPGPPGPKGDKGDKGDSAGGRWAWDDSTGTLVRNKGAASAQRTGAGTYQVVFSQDVTGCAYQATLGGPTTDIGSGQVSVSQLPSVAAGVRVQTRNSAGSLTNGAFFLTVFG